MNINQHYVFLYVWAFVFEVRLCLVLVYIYQWIFFLLFREMSSHQFDVFALFLRYHYCIREGVQT